MKADKPPAVNWPEINIVPPNHSTTPMITLAKKRVVPWQKICQTGNFRTVKMAEAIDFFRASVKVTVILSLYFFISKSSFAKERTVRMLDIASLAVSAEAARAS
jgi:hypothetical protein